MKKPSLFLLLFLLSGICVSLHGQLFPISKRKKNKKAIVVPDTSAKINRFYAPAHYFPDWLFETGLASGSNSVTGFIVPQVRIERHFQDKAFVYSFLEGAPIEHFDEPRSNLQNFNRVSLNRTIPLIQSETGINWVYKSTRKDMYEKLKGKMDERKHHNPIISKKRKVQAPPIIDIHPDSRIRQQHLLRFGHLYTQGTLLSSGLDQQYLVAEDGTVLAENQEEEQNGDGISSENSLPNVLTTNFRSSTFFVGWGFSTYLFSRCTRKRDNSLVHQQRDRVLYYFDLMYAPWMQLSPIEIGPGTMPGNNGTFVPAGTYNVQYDGFNTFQLNRFGARVGIDVHFYGSRKSGMLIFGGEIGIQPGPLNYQDGSGWVYYKTRIAWAFMPYKQRINIFDKLEIDKKLKVK